MAYPFNGILLTQKKGKVQQLQCENLKLLNEGCIASKVYMYKQNLKSPDFQPILTYAMVQMSPNVLWPVKKVRQKDCILYNSISVKCLEKAKKTNGYSRPGHRARRDLLGVT